MSSIQTPARLESWVSFLRAHAAITRQLNADLLNAHGLTLSDYEVLLRLSYADDKMMRRVDLAQSVLLTASGITRLLDGLEETGCVEKVACDSDARVSYARLTPAGSRKLSEAAERLGEAPVEELSKHLFRQRSWGPMADSETYAHLEHLRLAGEATRREEDGRMLYSLR